MARIGQRLTVGFVRSVERPGRYADGFGLYLRVGPSGGKSWIYRYRRGKHFHDLGLGPARLVSLSEARAKALELAKERLGGKDPAAERAATRVRERVSEAKRPPTFAECAARCIQAHSAGWKGSKNEEQWAASLAAYAYPVFGDLPVDQIDVGLVLKAVEPIWTTIPTTAIRVRRRVEAVLNWAAARGYRSGENPARWKGHLSNLLSKRTVKPVKHFAALHYTEVAAFLARLREKQAVPARALEFAVLTACRRNEAIEARWEEIDLEARLWTIPAGRTKTARQHRVPLSVPAIDLLRQQLETRSGDFVFSAREGKPLGESTIRMFLRNAWFDGVTTHGFRSTFRDWAAERTNFPPELVEEALAHTVGTATERAYRRTDLLARRQRLMQAWAEFCCAPATSGEIIAIGGAR